MELLCPIALALLVMNLIARLVLLILPRREEPALDDPISDLRARRVARPPGLADPPLLGGPIYAPVPSAPEDRLPLRALMRGSTTGPNVPAAPGPASPPPMLRRGPRTSPPYLPAPTYRPAASRPLLRRRRIALKPLSVEPAELQRQIRDLVDALTGAPLNPAFSLYRCAHCQVFYQASSVTVLRAENAGRCVSCLRFGHEIIVWDRRQILEVR